MNERKDYWFPAKSYGWGWGFPTAWQGWVVLAIYVAALAATLLLLRPDERPVEFFASLAALTIALLIVCAFKGEPPKWRWGSR